MVAALLLVASLFGPEAVARAVEAAPPVAAPVIEADPEVLSFPRAVGWAVLPQALDGYSTSYAIRHGGKEGNPILPDVEARVSAKAAVATVAGLGFYFAENQPGMKRLRRDPRWIARVLPRLPRFLYATVHIGAAAWNLKQGLQGRR